MPNDPTDKMKSYLCYNFNAHIQSMTNDAMASYLQPVCLQNPIFFNKNFTPCRNRRLKSFITHYVIHPSNIIHRFVQNLNSFTQVSSLALEKVNRAIPMESIKYQYCLQPLIC